MICAHVYRCLPEPQCVACHPAPGGQARPPADPSQPHPRVPAPPLPDQAPASRSPDRNPRPSCARPRGHVTAVPGVWCQLGLDRLIAAQPSRQRELAAATILAPWSRRDPSRLPPAGALRLARVLLVGDHGKPSSARPFCRPPSATSPRSSPPSGASSDLEVSTDGFACRRNQGAAPGGRHAHPPHAATTQALDLRLERTQYRLSANGRWFQ